MMKTKSFTFLLMFFIFSSTVGFTFSETVDINPISHTASQKADGVVIDNAGVFSKTEIQSLNNRADAMLDQDDIAIAVESIHSTHGEPIQEWATNRANNLGVGDAQKKNNGMLFVLAVDDREYYVATGTGLTKISNSELRSLLAKHLPKAFQKEEYAHGILSATYAYSEMLENTYCLPGTEVCFNEQETKLSIGVLVISTLGIGSYIIIQIRKTRQRKKDEKLQKEISDTLQQLSEKEHTSLLHASGLLNRKAKIERTGYLKTVQEYTEREDRVLAKIVLQSPYYKKNISLHSMQEEIKNQEKVEQATKDYAQKIYNKMDLSDRIEYRDQRDGARQDSIINRYQSSDIQRDPQIHNIMLRMMLMHIIIQDRDVRDAVSRRDSNNDHSSGSSGGSSTFGGGNFSGGGAGGSW